MSYVAEVYAVTEGYESDGPDWVSLGMHATPDKARRAIERDVKKRWKITAAWFAKEFRDGSRAIKYVGTSSKVPGKGPGGEYPVGTIARVWW